MKTIIGICLISLLLIGCDPQTKDQAKHRQTVLGMKQDHERAMADKNHRQEIKLGEQRHKHNLQMEEKREAAAYKRLTLQLEHGLIKLKEILKAAVPLAKWVLILGSILIAIYYVLKKQAAIHARTMEKEETVAKLEAFSQAVQSLPVEERSPMIERWAKSIPQLSHMN